MRKKNLVLGVLTICLTGCMSRQIESGLTQQEAQEIAVTLRQNGIDSRIRPEAGKKDNTWEVVGRGWDGRTVEAWKVLRENGLPRERTKGMEEIYSNSGMIPTAAEEKARLLVGLSGELSRTLKSVAGVVDARVHVVLPDNSPLLDKSQQTPTTASVLLKYQGSQPPLAVEEVKSLVARGIEGLAPDNVSVVMKRVQPKPAQDSPADMALGILQDTSVTFGAIILACIASLGALTLTARNRMARSKLEQLERRIEELTRASLGAPESVGKP